MDNKSSTSKPKCYVVDTSLLLHDPKAISVLGEYADIILPRSVISDLGRLEKSRAYDVAFTATEALNEIELLRGDNPKFNGGLLINKKHNLKVYGLPQGRVNVESLDQIIEVCQLPRLNKHYFPILVSKNKALRLMAASHDIHVEDYKYDAVENVYQGVEYLDHDLCNTDQLIDEQKIANRFFISNISDKVHVFTSGKLHLLEKNTRSKFSFFGITPRNREQIAAFWALTNPEIKFVSLQGKAGCGKTFLALLAGIQGLVSEKDQMYDKIIVTRAMESVDGKDLGALPGSAEDKISPYMDGVWDNLEIIKKNIGLVKSSNTSLKLNSSGKFDFESKITAVPFNLLRGRSLSNAFVIIDEAQNITPHAMKMLLTRLDSSSKVIIMGDNDQIDHLYLDRRSNGMIRAINHFKGYHQAAHITLISNERGDVSNFASKM